MMISGYFSFAWSADRGMLNSGETKTGYSIDAPSYMDTWTFNGQAGDRVIITGVPTSGNLDAYLILYPPGGGPAEAQPAVFLYDWIDHQLLQTGIYTIVIRDYGLAHSGTYNINFLKIPGSVSSTEDPDGGAIVSGETLSGTIDVPSDRDAFQFYGQAGDRVIITAVPTSGNLDAYLILYPPGGGPAEAQPAVFLYDWIDHQLQMTGLYTIVVIDYGMNKSGNYNINLLKNPGAVSSPGDPDGGAIASGETLSGTIDVPSDRDAFQFYGQAGDRVIITAVPTSGNLDAYLILYPPGGGPAEAQPAVFLYDWIDHQLQMTGLYTIVVIDYGMNKSGNYNISLVKIPSDLRPGIYNPSPGNGATIVDCCRSLSWNSVTGATGYDLYFGEDVIVPLSQIGDNLSSSSMPFPAMERNKVYYWHVVAHTPGGDIQGPYWWFYTSFKQDEIIGTWASGIWYWNPATSGWTQMYNYVPSGPIAAGDVTGDGRADVVSCWPSGLWYQNGATLGWTKVYGSAPSKVAAGDITGDGRAEIIGTWGTGIWYWNPATSGWTKMFSYIPSGPIAAGDVTGDGRADVVSCWPSGLWYQDGATLGWTKLYSVCPSKLAVGDITGDCRAEIIGAWSTGIWYWNPVNFGWTKMYSSVPSGPIAAGDVTGDCRADVVSCWPSGLWYQNGATLGWTKVYNVAPSKIAVGDITGN